MKNTFGNNLHITLGGESHGDSLFAVLDGLRPGTVVDESYIASRLTLRRPSGNISTPRKEADEFKIISGVYEGKATGTPLCILIPNTAKKSADYDETRYLPRPSHADYSAFLKYGGYQDHRGGGHFSGRVTAALVAAGAIAQLALENEGIKIGTHIKNIGPVADRGFENLENDITYLSDKTFPVLSEESGEEMINEIEKARNDLDSIGGTLETAVIGMNGGYGEPWFDTCEGMLSHALFSIPGVKAVGFGLGEKFGNIRGSEANDAFTYENGKVVTKTNNNGGINGGITNGMPITFTVTVKPTPSIAKEQSTVDLKNCESKAISVHGRHDPCIVHRAAAVVNAVTALTLLDLIYTRDGNAPKGTI
ncbi:MAG: chorismate synthase [Clostridia bacterium]|nr:chorismate synthase [Clostridia bacterium]